MSDNFIARDELLYHFIEIMPEPGENELADEMYALALNARALDVDYRRHGRWEHAEKRGVVTYSDAYRQCSVCMNVVYMAYGMAYCPVCGARMDGGGA